MSSKIGTAAPRPENRGFGSPRPEAPRAIAPRPETPRAADPAPRCDRCGMRFVPVDCHGHVQCSNCGQIVVGGECCQGSRCQAQEK